MKNANQLMATMGNLPNELPLPPLSIDVDSARVVNALFRELKAIFPAWKQAWPKDDDEKAAKKSWVKAFVAARISQIEQIRFGIERCRKQGSHFIPSVGQFVAMCMPTAEDFGMPPTADAWIEALMGAYSHEAVKISAMATGLFELRTAKHEDKGLRARFERNYEIALRRAQAGQPLSGGILDGISYDSQKSDLELAHEQADRQVLERIRQQGIPASGAAARDLLMAKFGKRRAP